MRWLVCNGFGRRAVLAMAFGFALLALADGAVAAAFVGQAVKTLGDVRVSRDGADISCGSGTSLQLGDVIKTGPGARLRLRLVDGSILTLGENTTVSIDIFAVDPGNSSRTVIMTVLNGIVNAAAAKSGENQFDYQIRTANAYSAVRGTKWIVAAPQNTVKGPPPGATSLYVINGVVELGSTTSKPSLVNAGSWATVDAQGNVSPSQPTTPAILQPVVAATSDTGGGGSGGLAPAPTPTTPAPQQVPTNTFPEQPKYQRATRGEKQRPGKDTNHH